MVCAEPFARCEICFFQPSLANAALSGLDAILADAGIGAVVRQLPWAKAISIEPAFTLGALPRGTFCFLQLHAFFAILAQSAATQFAPLMRWKMLLELHDVASDAQRLWHVLGCSLWREVMFGRMDFQFAFRCFGCHFILYS